MTAQGKTGIVTVYFSDLEDAMNFSIEINKNIGPFKGGNTPDLSHPDTPQDT
jgi:hypothetical protein